MSDPAVTYLEDSYRFVWDVEQVEMVLEAFRGSSQGLKAELTITTSRRCVVRGIFLSSRITRPIRRLQECTLRRQDTQWISPRTEKRR